MKQISAALGFAITVLAGCDLPPPTCGGAGQTPCATQTMLSDGYRDEWARSPLLEDGGKVVVSEDEDEIQADPGQPGAPPGLGTRE